jgi:hypothetical protein
MYMSAAKSDIMQSYTLYAWHVRRITASTAPSSETSAFWTGGFQYLNNITSATMSWVIAGTGQTFSGQPSIPISITTHCVVFQYIGGVANWSGPPPISCLHTFQFVCQRAPDKAACGTWRVGIDGLCYKIPLVYRTFFDALQYCTVHNGVLAAFGSNANVANIVLPIMSSFGYVVHKGSTLTQVVLVRLFAKQIKPKSLAL